MENIRGFIDMYLNMDNMWIITVGISIFILTIIGYFADKANKRRKSSLDDGESEEKKEKKPKEKTRKAKNNQKKNKEEKYIESNIEEPIQGNNREGAVIDSSIVTPIVEEPASIINDSPVPATVIPEEPLENQPVDIEDGSTIEFDSLKLDANEPNLFGLEPNKFTNNGQDNQLENLVKLGEASIQEPIGDLPEENAEEEKLEFISDDTV